MPRSNTSERWVLAFDASCGTCREISHAIDDASDGRLEVLPLERPEVQRWRVRSFGEKAPFTPTLLKVCHEGEAEVVRAWTSRRMALPLIGRLGPRRTLRVLAELGRLREEVNQPLGRQQGALNRKAFLRLGAGVAVAGGLLLVGKVPAFAEERKAAAARWVAQARNDLPQTYEAFSRYALDYRREIYRALPADVRAKLWREHLKHYRATHPTMSALQERTFARMESFVSDDSVFNLTEEKRSEVRQVQQELQSALLDDFGKDEAYQIIATLGPSLSRRNTTAERLVDCECNMNDDWCNGGQLDHCIPSGSCPPSGQPKGCGWLWEKPCDGYCYW